MVNSGACTGLEGFSTDFPGRLKQKSRAHREEMPCFYVKEGEMLPRGGGGRAFPKKESIPYLYGTPSRGQEYI